MICITNRIGEHLASNETLKPAIRGHTLFRRTLSLTGVDRSLPESMLQMARSLVHQQPLNLGATEHESQQVTKSATTDVLKKLAEAVGRGSDSLRILQNGLATRDYRMHGHWGSPGLDLPVTYVDHAAAAAVANLPDLFRQYFTSLPVPRSFGQYHAGGHYYCSALYGHPMKMAAIMGHDQILRQIWLHINSHRSINLHDIIDAHDLDSLILDTIRLHRPNILHILLSFRGVWQVGPPGRAQSRSHQGPVPLTEWLNYALEKRNIPALNIILTIPYAEGGDRLNLAEFFKLGNGNVVAKLVAKFPTLIQEHYTIKLTLTAFSYKASILELAVLNGNEEVLRTLVNAGAPVDGIKLDNARADSKRKRPLHTAIEHQKLGMVHILLRSGARIMENLKSCRQDTQLLAAQTGNRAIFDLVANYKRNQPHVRVWTYEEALRRWRP